MKPFDSCPVCGGELIRKKVEKILKGGGNTAIVRVYADVCLHCGERLYSEDAIRRFEEIRVKLGRGDTGEFTEIGSTYEAV